MKSFNICCAVSMVPENQSHFLLEAQLGIWIMLMKVNESTNQGAESDLSKKRSCLAATLGVKEFITAIDMILVTDQH